MTKTTIISFILMSYCLGVADAQSSRVIRGITSKTVLIIPMDEEGQPLGLGSGFIVGKNGEIATNYHVIEGAASAVVKFANKDKKYPVIQMLYQDPIHDLAVIGLDIRTSPLKIGDDKKMEIGERILAVGNPGGLTGTVSDGIISGFRKAEDGTRVMQITAPISPGSSGGPVIDERGETVGIASAGLLVGQNLNFAIPISLLKNLMSSKSLNKKFDLSDFPKRNKSQFPGGINVQNKASTELVRVINFSHEQNFTSNHLAFSIQNKTRHDITAVKLLIIWISGGERVHYNALLINDKIPAFQAKRIMKRTGDAFNPRIFLNKELKFVGHSYIIRVLDYEILPTSGEFEFR
jgi:hypothetical protein